MITWQEYSLQGWGTPFPIPLGKKSPPPAGVTGRKAKEFPEEGWADVDGSSNMALRVPEGIVGLDLDLYKGFRLEWFESNLGALPETIAISAGGIQRSMTQLFRVPKGAEWVSAFPGRVASEIIQPHHRYLMLPGSKHPLGFIYKWISSKTGADLGHIPSPEEASVLPDSWISFLRKETHQNIMAVSEIAETVAQSFAPVPCPVLQKTGQRGVSMIATAASRHDTLVRASWALISLASKGHSPSEFEMQKTRLAQAFSLRFQKGDASKRGIEKEVERVFSEGIAKLGASWSPRNCTCRSRGRVVNRHQNRLFS